MQTEFLLAMLLVVLVCALTTAAVLLGFQRWVLTPYLDAKMQEIREASASIEQRVADGVRDGIRRTLREIPENTVKDTTRHMAKMGSEFLENGLGSLLGKYPNGYEPRRRDS